MTILQANKFFYLRGGAERHLFELSRYLGEKEHVVVPFAMSHPKNVASEYAPFFADHVETAHPKLRDLPLLLKRLVYDPSVKRSMASLLDVVSPDVAHLHNIYTQLSPSLIAPLRAKKIPVVMTVHDHHLVSPSYVVWANGKVRDVRHDSFMRASFSRFHKGSLAASALQTLSFKLTKLAGWYQNGVDRFISPSDYLKRQMVEAGFARDRITVIPHGIDLKAFRAGKSHEGYVLFVGRLSPEKGLPILLDLARLFPHLPFWIAGEGSESDRLHQELRALPNVRLLGFRRGEELASLYRKAMCLVMPAQTHEVFPYVVLEALASGIPVIASDVGGISEMIDDGRTGFLVPPTSLERFAESLVRIASDVDRRFEMGRQARLVAEQRFDDRLSFERVLALYRELIHTKNAPSL